MTSHTSPPIKILFDKLIRTHHSCKCKKTPVYNHLKSTMPEKPRFEVHLPISKSNWNISSLTFQATKALETLQTTPWPQHKITCTSGQSELSDTILSRKEQERLTRSSEDVVIVVKSLKDTNLRPKLPCTPQSFIACQRRST